MVTFDPVQFRTFFVVLRAIRTDIDPGVDASIGGLTIT
jgi:hypothetical protein